MTGPFNLLGVAADADERTIKLAYAKLLKLTRPDDDPEGFQRLNQAYQQALNLARSRITGIAMRRGQVFSRPMTATLNLSANAPRVATPRLTRAGEPAYAAPSRPPPILAQPAPEPAAPRPQRPAFDAQAFLAEYRRISAGGANALSRWLMDYPAFWHLPTKHAAGQWLLRTLFEKPEAMPEGCFTATSEFFHYEDALSGIDPMILRRIGTRINAASLVKPEQARELALYAFRNNQWNSRKHCIRAVRRLSRPFRWWRELAHALWVPAVRKIAAVANALCNGNPDDLPAPIDRAHARFWMDAFNPAKSRVRLLLALFRSAAALALIPLAFAALAGLMQHLLQAPDPLKSALDAWEAVFVAVGFVVVMFWVPIGTRAIFKQADALTQRSRTFRLLMLSLTPVMCAAALLVTRVIDATLGVLLAIVTLFVAIWRLRATHGKRKLKPGEYIALAFLFFVYLNVVIALCGTSTSPVDPVLLPTLATVVVTLAIWAFDWFKRGFLHPRTPRMQR